MALKYRAALQASALDHAPDLWARMMLSGVIFDRQNLKVRKSVVGLDSVSVVDVLSARQASAKVSFHDDTVLKLKSIANSNRDVPI